MNTSANVNKMTNLRQLRKSLHLTQQEFLNRYFSDKRGKARISVASLSNLEKKGGPKLDEVIAEVCDALELEEELFQREPGEFRSMVTGEIRNLVDSGTRQEESSSLPDGTSEGDNSRELESGKTGSLQLINRLTTYFAEQFFLGKLNKGDRIESDRDLAIRMGVSREAIHDSMKVLAVMGIVQMIPGKGTFLAENDENFLEVPLSWSLFMSNTQIDNIVEVRNILQENSARMAAANTDRECMGQLHEISYKSYCAYKRRDFQAFLEADIEFHTCIARCSGNRVIYQMTKIISDLMRRVSSSGMEDVEQLTRIYEEHERIYGLILAGDGDGAAAAMLAHEQSALQRYTYYYDTEGDRKDEEV